MIIIDYFKRLKRIKEAKKYGIPFKERVWYNYRAMLSKDSCVNTSFIEIFDEKGRYIKCPGIGEEVVYNSKGERYIYRIVGFDNDSRNRDWLYDSDYIHPICEYIGKVK